VRSEDERRSWRLLDAAEAEHGALYEGRRGDGEAR
jgi:hypothetical protein